jgi:uncharacterized membrane protein YfcA
LILESITAGLIAGLFGALVGLGGGVLMVPALVLLFNLPMTEAIPASLVGVVATAMGGTAMYLKENHTNPELAVRAGCATILGALAGAKVAVHTPERWLELAFAVLMFIIVWRLNRARNHEPTAQAYPAVWKAGGLFAGAGLLAGLLGVGGGVLNVPAIRLALRRPMLEAVATSTMIISFTAAAAAAAHAAAGHMNWSVAVGCATGAFAGGRAGAFLAPRLPRRSLHWVFVAVVLYVAIEMAVRGLGVPWWR